MQHFKQNISALEDLINSLTYQDFQDQRIQTKISSYLKKQGLFLHLDNHYNNLINGRSDSSQPTHPSLILYAAVSQAFHFDDSKYLEVRQNLIAFLTQNLAWAQSISKDMGISRDVTDARELLEALEDPAND